MEAQPESDELQALTDAHAISLVQLAIPPTVAALSIKNLTLPKRTVNALIRSGVLSIGQLATLSDADLLEMRNVGTTALQEVRQALHNMSAEALLEASYIQEELAIAEASRTTEQPQPTIPVALAETAGSEVSTELPQISISAAIYMLLTQIEPRQAEVLRLRYGLAGNAVHTLAEVGEKQKISRERVRQIETKALKQLKYPYRHLALNSIILHLRKALYAAHGVLAVEAAQHTLAQYEHAHTPVSESLLRFILLFAPDIETIKPFPIIALNQEPFTPHVPAIGDICTLFRRITDQALAPLSRTDMLTRFGSDTEGQQLCLTVPETFLLACLNAHPDISTDEAGLYGLKRWANKRLDDIIVVLREHGQAMHYSELAEQVNQRLPVDQQTTAHNVHAQIGRLPEVFARVGHGIFGLTEWGLKQDRTLADASYRVLRETKHALHIEELTDRILATWHVKRTSVRAAIDLDNRFIEVGRNLYWLTDSSLTETTGAPTNDFETLYGETLLRRSAELERDGKPNESHDTLEEFRRLKNSIFGQ